MKIKTTAVKPSYYLILHHICNKCGIWYYHVKDWPLHIFTVEEAKVRGDLRLQFLTTPTLKPLPEGLVARLEQLEALLKRWGYLKGRLVISCQHHDLGVKSQRR